MDESSRDHASHRGEAASECLLFEIEGGAQAELDGCHGVRRQGTEALPELGSVQGGYLMTHGHASFCEAGRARGQRHRRGPEAGPRLGCRERYDDDGLPGWHGMDREAIASSGSDHDLGSEDTAVNTAEQVAGDFDGDMGGGDFEVDG